MLAFQPPQGPAWLLFGVFAAIVVGPVVASWLRLPSLVGVLLAGMVIGPKVLGIVPSTDTTVSAFGQLGLLYLMFSTGVELDLVQFRRCRRAAVAFGLLTFSAPLALGFVSGVALHYSLAASLLLGSLWASHTLVTYPMVRKAGLSTNHAVASTVGATVITDTLSLIVLAAVAGTVTGSESLGLLIGELLLGVMLVVAYAGWLLPRVSQWFFSGPGQERGARYGFLVAALLSSAVVAEMVGIEGIVGAFFAGVGLNRRVPAGSALLQHVDFFGTALFSPLFLVSVGVLIDPAVVASWETLRLAAIFLGALTGGKALAALAARWLLGTSRAEASLMFGLSLSQAAATLAATFVGFKIGLFGEREVNAVLVVIPVSLVIAALTTTRSIGNVEPAPAESTALGSKVVVVAGREDRLVGLAKVAASVVAPDGGVVVPLRVARDSSMVAPSRQFLGVVEDVMAREGLETNPRLRVDDDVVRAVCSTAEEESASLLLVDWQAATPYQPALRGNRDDQLLATTPVPVLLATMSDMPHRRVIFAVDECDLEAEATQNYALADEVARRVAGSESTRLRVGPDDFSEDRYSWLVDHAMPGDLVVLPGNARPAAFRESAVRMSARAGVSLIVPTVSAFDRALR